MSAVKLKLEAQANRLRSQVATAEATLGMLRTRLAKIEAKLTGAPAPETGLDLLWAAALPMARTRSSKLQCRTAWNRIPKHERPTVQVALTALHAWNACHEWRKDGSQFAPALHRYIKNRMWEDPPETNTTAPSRYRSTPKAIPQTAPEDAATPEDIAAIFAPLSPRRMNS